MTHPLTRDRQLRRTRRAEAALTALVFVALLLVGQRPDWIARYGPWITGGLLGLLALGTGITVWQYRVMDEFRRVRLLKAWALAGIVSFLVMTGLIAWAAVGWAGHGQPAALARNVPPPTFTLTDLYIPWAAALAAYLLTTAFLYVRDQRS